MLFPLIFVCDCVIMDNNINKALNNLRLELIQKYASSTNLSFSRSEKRPALIEKIEIVTLEVIKAIAQDEAPDFETINFSQFDNCCFDGRLKLKDSTRFKKRKISFGRSRSRSRFAVVMFLLSKIHKLLLACKTSTKRELYYGNLTLFKTQKEVNNAMMDVCYILNSPPWELGVISTVKGIVAGPLLLKLEQDVIISCNKPGGVLIPENILEAELVSTNIQWVLIIEKDAVFQNILDANGLEKFRDCLFVTGKGFPDINTRLLICRLWECFKIPILALVDADPYGLEIMCVYRFGSVKSSLFSDRLACPSVRWLGVHPSDIKLLAMDFKTMSEKDIHKLTRLAKRAYITENEKIRNEVKILMDEKIKAEIEGISNVSWNYMTDVYIPSKIQCREYF